MDYCNTSDIEYLSDEISDMYHRFIRAQFFMGGIILITTFTNMTILCSIKSKLKELNRSLMPPLYKVTS